jgi:phosphohistidine phosphatase
MDDTRIWADRLESLEEDIKLVGHLPHLGRLASLLLCGDPQRVLVNFTTAGMVCMRRTGEDWGIDWIITPAIVP